MRRITFRTGNKQRNNPTSAHGPPETVLSSQTSCIGTITSSGDVYIAGAFEGALDVEGEVFIDSSAYVHAAITAQNVQIAGAVSGEITAIERLEILPTGKVWGNIVTAMLQIATGGLYHRYTHAMPTAELEDNGHTLGIEAKLKEREIGA
jgi:cytoskeletal protein CcmA (bactofilin family)